MRALFDFKSDTDPTDLGLYLVAMMLAVLIYLLSTECTAFCMLGHSTKNFQQQQSALQFGGQLARGFSTGSGAERVAYGPSSSESFAQLAMQLGSAQCDVESFASPCKIKVIGVGGGGGNAVNRMIGSDTSIAGVEMWTVNTDAQALSKSLASSKLNIGKTTSRYVVVQLRTF
jgi:hypothetical protein